VQLVASGVPELPAREDDDDEAAARSFAPLSAGGMTTGWLRLLPREADGGASLPALDLKEAGG
jgi:hypothetical protein